MEKKQYPPKTIKHRTNQKYLEKYKGKSEEAEEIGGDMTSNGMMRITPEEEYEAYAAQYFRTGYLKTQAVEAQKTFPVPGVQVEIFKEFPSGEYIIDTQMTDESGLTEAVELPAMEGYQSTVPGLAQPFTTYDVRFIKPGYTTIIVRDVPVYEDITTFQQREMILKGVTPDAVDVLEYVVKPPVV